MPDFVYQPIFEHARDETPYRRLDEASKHVEVVEEGDRRAVRVGARALELLAAEAFDDISHLLRPGHLAQLRKVFDDPESSPNDRFVALELLVNANIASARELPGCQDTGTAIVVGYKGEDVRTGIDDAEALSRGIYETYQTKNLRYSQMAPLDLYTEKNTGTNLPAQIELYAEPGDEYRLLFIANRRARPTTWHW
jgi:fumarate hydratase class I